MISIEKIEEIDSNDILFQNKLKVLLEAENNWDVKCVYLQDYLEAIKEYLGWYNID